MNDPLRMKQFKRFRGALRIGPKSPPVPRKSMLCQNRRLNLGPPEYLERATLARVENKIRYPRHLQPWGRTILQRGALQQVAEVDESHFARSVRGRLRQYCRPEPKISLGHCVRPDRVPVIDQACRVLDPESQADRYLCDSRPEMICSTCV